jgi:hypothetical protein
MNALPNVWGKGGALFAFSGLDGKTDWRRPLVGSTLAMGRGIRFHTECPISIECKIGADGTAGEIVDEVVAGDVICSRVVASGSTCRVRYLFLDKDTVVGEIRCESAQQRTEVMACVTVEGAEAGNEANLLVFRAGREEFALAASGPGLAMDSRGARAVLGTGDTLLFSFGYAQQDAEGAACERALTALPTDRDALYDERVGFFRSLPQPRVSDPELLRTYYKCASVQRVNCLTAEGAIAFDWTTPDRWPHRDMWIWDSAFHALGLRHFAPEWARSAIKAVLSVQRPSGYIPHQMRPDPAYDSGIIQPPILGWAAWRVYETCGDRAFLEYCYPRLGLMVSYDREEVDADGDGLSEWTSGGASGMDNSPRFDQPTGAAVDLNSYLANEMLYLEKMANVLGLAEDAAQWARAREETAARVNELLWDEDSGFYCDLKLNGAKSRIKTEAGFTPLFAGICSNEQAAALVEHLMNPNEFWREFPVSSVGADESTFCDDMWRGPTWVNYNYLVIEGLLNCGYDEQAAELREMTLQEIARWYASDGVIYEYYDSEGVRSPSALHRKGKCGPPAPGISESIRDYHWSAALFVDLLLSDGSRGEVIA